MAVLSMFLGLLVVPAAHAVDVRVGDAGAVPDPAKFDPKYPDMKEWASAGVRGGIPARAAGKVIKKVKPGENVQAAVDETMKRGWEDARMGRGLIHPRECPTLSAFAKKWRENALKVD